MAEVGIPEKAHGGLGKFFTLLPRKLADLTTLEKETYLTDVVRHHWSPSAEIVEHFTGKPGTVVQIIL
jgi:hypothetical protein